MLDLKCNQMELVWGVTDKRAKNRQAIYKPYLEFVVIFGMLLCPKIW